MTPVDRGQYDTPEWHGQSTSESEFRCSSCGYGAASGPPPSCPICGTGSWEVTRSRRGTQLTIRRPADTIFLLTPPREIDGETSVALAETIAGLAHAHPEVVLDLTAVEDIEDRAGRLILHLSSLTRRAGGRLLAICPSGRESALAVHELDPDKGGTIDEIEGALGRTLRRITRADRR
jgi:anti-anti-sigma regulatory factor